MSTKKQVEKLLDYYGPKFIALLGLNHFSISWYILHSNSRAVKKHGFDYGRGAAETYWHLKSKCPKKYSIAIFYDKQHGKKDIIGSIFHELMHIRFRKLMPVLKFKTKFEKKAHILEESMVKDLEQVIISLL